MNVNDKVRVIGPEGSAQFGKTGVVIDNNPPILVVKLDGEERPRNFQSTDLAKE